MKHCRYSSELYTSYDELNVVKVIKVGILWWLGQLFRMQELDPCRRLTFLKPEDTQSVGKPKGTTVAQWLRHCAANRKVAGSIPDGVIRIFL